MSWELASFLIVGGVVIGGFAWYERSRPPSQVVALVAALAALAIAGRVAFAAFPNVKPTTDIVIFAGFALGAAPGFAVGALAALVSNFWFGQGPWTPWQMAAWGLCGVLGAALALGWRNVGRFGLAATCGLAAVLYGALLNFSLMATYGGDLSWQRFLVLEGRAVPFEVAHAAGNVVLALVAGPAMVRMLVRFRERFEWSRSEAPTPPELPAPPRSRLAPRLRGGGIALLLIAVLALAAAPSTHAAAPALRATASDAASGPTAARAWLESVENDDGGWGESPGKDSSVSMTGWVMLGLEAAGRNPLDAAAAGRTPVDYLRGEVAQVKSDGDLSRTILALEGAGVDPRSFGGRNLVAALLARHDGDGSYEDWPGTSAFAAIALRAAGIDVTGTLNWLRKVQNDDGGWGDVPGSPSTPDGTGSVMQALGKGSKAAQRGLSYLRGAQRPGGGFALGGGGVVNTQSTAWAIQGILALGGNPAGLRHGSAPDYLASQQQSDGSYRYSKSSDQTPVWVTGQDLVAAAGAYFPIAPPPRQPQPKPKAKTSPAIPAAPGGTAPSRPLAPIPPPSTEAAPGTSPAVPPTGSEAGSSGAGAAAGGGRAKGGPAPGAGGPSPGAGPDSGGLVSPLPESASPGPEQPVAPAETSADGADGGSGGSSALGAVVVGLLAGGLLFALGWGGRRLWMRQRYGL